MSKGSNTTRSGGANTRAMSVIDSNGLDIMSNDYFEKVNKLPFEKRFRDYIKQGSGIALGSNSVEPYKPKGWKLLEEGQFSILQSNIEDNSFAEVDGKGNLRLNASMLSLMPTIRELGENGAIKASTELTNNSIVNVKLNRGLNVRVGMLDEFAKDAKSLYDREVERVKNEKTERFSDGGSYKVMDVKTYNANKSYLDRLMTKWKNKTKQ